MKSIERRFRETERTPGWSTLTCFSVAVGGQGFSKDRIGRWFSKLVDLEDYQKDSALKKELLAWLEKHTHEDRKDARKNTVISHLVLSKKDAEAYEKERGFAFIRPLVRQI